MLGSKNPSHRFAVPVISLFSLVALGILAGCGSNAGTPHVLSFPGDTKSVVIPDGGNNRVLLYNPPFTSGQSANVVLGQADFTTQTTGFTAATMSSPIAVATDSQGNLYVTDANNCRILQFVPPFSNGMNASIAIGAPNLTTSSCVPGATANTMFMPIGVAFDGKGNLWVADSGNSRVLEFTPPFSNGMAASLAIGQQDLTSGGPGPCASPSTASVVCFPSGVAFDASGNLWVSDTDDNRVLEFTPPFSSGMQASLELGQPSATAFTVTTANNGGVLASSLDQPAAMTFDSRGNLWVDDAANNRVLEFEPPFANGMSATAVLGQTDFASDAANQGLSAPTATTLSNPRGLVFYNEDKLFVGDTGNNRTVLYSPSGAAAQDVPIVLGQTDFSVSAANGGAPGPSASTQSAPFEGGPSVIALAVFIGLVTLWLFVRRKQSSTGITQA